MKNCCDSLGAKLKIEKKWKKQEENVQQNPGNTMTDAIPCNFNQK